MPETLTSGMDTPWWGAPFLSSTPPPSIWDSQPHALPDSLVPEWGPGTEHQCLSWDVLSLTGWFIFLPYGWNPFPKPHQLPSNLWLKCIYGYNIWRPSWESQRTVSSLPWTYEPRMIAWKGVDGNYQLRNPEGTSREVHKSLLNTF